MQRVYHSPGANYNTFIPPRTGQDNKKFTKSLAKYHKSLSLPVGYEEKDLGLPTSNFDEDNSSPEPTLAGDHPGYHNSILL